jgi:enoyl-CoA hydratase/carnithine racemase
MIRTITNILCEWKEISNIHAVFIHANQERSFCAGGDIRFLYEASMSASTKDSTLLEDFFTEEYSLNHLIHQYPKPIISLLDGIVMGGGMGIGQGSINKRCRIVTEHTKMAMPEVNIGFFPDVGGSYFLSRCPGYIGIYLGVVGEVINAADAIYAGLADLYLPSEHISALLNYIEQTNESDLCTSIYRFASVFQSQLPVSRLAQHHNLIDQHFSYNNVTEIYAALNKDYSPYAQHILKVMQTRSPLMMCVTLEQLRRGKHLSFAECLCMERTMVQHCFKYGEVLEGIRALVVDKDRQPKWQPAKLEQVSNNLINHFFEPVWPDYDHPLRELKSN